MVSALRWAICLSSRVVVLTGYHNVSPLQVLICGPPPMIKFACKPALAELEFSEDMLLIW